MSYTSIGQLLQSFLPLIDLLLYLTALANTSSTMLNNSGDREHPCLVPDLSVSISILSKMLGFEKVYIKLYHVKYSSIPTFLSVPIRNGC